MRALFISALLAVVFGCNACKMYHEGLVWKDLSRMYITRDTIIDALAGYAPDSLGRLLDRSEIYVVLCDSVGTITIVGGDLDYPRSSDSVIALVNVRSEGLVREPVYDVRSVRRIVLPPDIEPYEETDWTPLMWVVIGVLIIGVAFIAGLSILSGVRYPSPSIDIWGPYD